MTLATDDILAIQKLIADYNHIVDVGDGEEFARCSPTTDRLTPGSTS
jgi:hypothetical protein